ncbi:hypothetical protein FGL86_12070 [Pistricoccus aurantiacus]|uniref:EpsG family protein n=1 Tax=Pistricoccus aurantiacus TaxID=1883414 RepID=A0A5B8SY30_9GAMM|nr:hypothetical protein [Pistricoccus aurantiacus]QEA39733.1 hypothetical protein FGL86_12070 [Pistricoccus aurantiacus]
MILLTFLLSTALLLISTKSRELKFYFFSVLILTVIVHLVFAIEFSITSDSEYFVSDEIIYAYLGEGLDQLAIQDRWFWIVLNKLAKYPLEDPWFAQKFINLIALPLYFYVLYKMLDSALGALLIFIFFPYLFYMFQVDLRDMTAFVLFMSACYFFFHYDVKIFYRLTLVVLCLFALVFLRPFYVPIIIVSLGISVALKNIVSNFRLNPITLLKSILLLGFVIAIFIFSNSIELFYRFFGRAEYVLENGIQTLDGTVVSFSTGYAVQSIIRFFATPIPISLFSQVFVHGNSDYGYTHDVLRIISQFSLYFFILFFMYLSLKKPGAMIKVIIHPPRLAFFIGIILTVVIYSIYFGGGSHTRIKIGIYHLFFIPCAIIYKDYFLGVSNRSNK